eukprot:3499075-Alexandrium_andersonii.AAC.1
MRLTAYAERRRQGRHGQFATHCRARTARKGVSNLWFTHFRRNCGLCTDSVAVSIGRRGRIRQRMGH